MFHLSVPLSEIEHNETAQEWFRQERVRTEENNLASAHPTNVGFLLLAIPKSESLPLYQARLKLALGNNHPDFFLNISPVFPE